MANWTGPISSIIGACGGVALGTYAAQDLKAGFCETFISSIYMGAIGSIAGHLAYKSAILTGNAIEQVMAGAQGTMECLARNSSDPCSSETIRDHLAPLAYTAMAVTFAASYALCLKNSQK